MRYLDDQGRLQEVRTPQDWQRRRREILQGMQLAMGTLPDRAHLPPLDMRVTARAKGDGFTRLSISYALGSGSVGRRVPAYLLIPDSTSDKRFPAMLALHQTTPTGKAEVIGLGKPNMAYGLELARRGYVVLCPDYPSFGDYACDFSDPAFASGTMLGIAGHMRSGSAAIPSAGRSRSYRRHRPLAGRAQRHVPGGVRSAHQSRRRKLRLDPLCRLLRR